jgi:hypothetical protein
MIEYKLREIIYLAFHLCFLIDHNSLLRYLCAHFFRGLYEQEKSRLGPV